MASVSLDEETAEQTIARMTRELEHVSEQSRVSHRMAIYWREEYNRAEKLRVRMEKSLHTWRKKLLGWSKDEVVTETMLKLWTEESEADTPTGPSY